VESITPQVFIPDISPPEEVVVRLHVIEKVFAERVGNLGALLHHVTQ
jgi:hypothetical protein